MTNQTPNMTNQTPTEIPTEIPNLASSVFNPLPWQLPPFYDISDVVLLTGSVGGGKSTICAEKCHAFATKYPGSTVLILRKNREAMTNSTILFFERNVVGKSPHVVHKSSAHRFEYSNGSIVAYGGMADSKQREQIRSIGQSGGLDFVWMEEATAFTEEDYNEILGRMRGRAAPWRQIILSTNPGAPSHWIHQRLMLKGQASVHYSKASDNHHNPDDYAKTLEGITGVQRDRLVLGQWKQAEGAVYSDFDRALHMVEPFFIPPQWRRIRVVDFGYTNPFVCQWWAIDGDNRMYLYREIYRTKRIVADHAQQIKQLSQGERIEITICDHDAEDRATLEREGIDNIAAFKDISPGIEAIRSRLRRANDGKPRLFIVSGALVEVDAELEKSKKPWSTDQEFEVYAYPKSIEGKPTKDLPAKDYDHGMDAMRYAVAYIDDLQTTTYLPDNPKNLDFGPIHRQFDNWLSPTKMPMF